MAYFLKDKIISELYNSQKTFLRSMVGHDFDEAILYYKQALRANSKHADAHNNWGVVLYKKRRHKEALRINPDFKEAQNNLEVALREADKNAKGTKKVLTP